MFSYVSFEEQLANYNRVSQNLLQRHLLYPKYLCVFLDHLFHKQSNRSVDSGETLKVIGVVMLAIVQPIEITIAHYTYWQIDDH